MCHLIFSSFPCISLNVGYFGIHMTRGGNYARRDEREAERRELVMQFEDKEMQIFLW